MEELNEIWQSTYVKVFNTIIDKAFDIIVAFIILIIGFKIIKILMKMFKRFLIKIKIDESLYKYLINISEVGLKILLIVVLVNQIGFDTAPFVAVLGTAGLAIGLALQGSLSNFAGGVLILLFKPFKVGDFIEAQGYQGTVNEISIFYTNLNTVDNKKIIIPNGNLSNSSCINYSANDKRRVDITFSVGYESDISKVKQVIKNIVYSHELILKDPEPIIRMIKHDESSINFTTRVWCNTENYWDIYFDLMEQVKTEFDKEGINIPYPHMNITMINN
ncbi:mechanosensitive ion channel family protein [Clostridium grantii]|uniref:Small conductance mechanosensitive channel n=1 Tax=Clostridium grantii DSM 8605 TaxID=1121316 RepID=A0A1M5V8M0_9CLOT|nr:mechanosensitive ion channel domain-containing protein [Clostridium grantii]SHH71283.1 small conductance mechanosensitive channel [Clostridium grantii DSM 8605]